MLPEQKLPFMSSRTDPHNSIPSQQQGLALTGRASCRPLVWLAVVALVAVSLSIGAADGWAKSKRTSAPRPEPELKILELNISPSPYAPRQGTLEFSLTIQLPKELNRATVLEVSSLVSLPSKTSLRFLSDRKPVHALFNDPTASAQGAGKGESHTPNSPPRIQMRLTWDGNDQQQQIAPAGAYDYEVRAKLLTMGEKGARTLMTAWPKRGTLVVK